MNLRRWFPLSVSVTFPSVLTQPVAKGRFSRTATAFASWLRAALLVGLSCSCPAGATAQRPESSAPPPPTPQLLRGEQFGDAPLLHAPPVASAGASLWSRLWNGWSSNRTETRWAQEPHLPPKSAPGQPQPDEVESAIQDIRQRMGGVGESFSDLLSPGESRRLFSEALNRVRQEQPGQQPLIQQMLPQFSPNAAHPQNSQSPEALNAAGNFPPPVSRSPLVPPQSQGPQDRAHFPSFVFPSGPQSSPSYPVQAVPGPHASTGAPHSPVPFGPVGGPNGPIPNSPPQVLLPTAYPPGHSFPPGPSFPPGHSGPAGPPGPSGPAGPSGPNIPWGFPPAAETEQATVRRIARQLDQLAEELEGLKRYDEADNLRSYAQELRAAVR